MSNAEASKLYETIIEDVINDSRQDFENNAIDESTLQELRKIWCEKLSQTGVAKFSWDEEYEEHHDEDHQDDVQSNTNGTASNNVLDGLGNVSDLGDVPTTTDIANNGSELELPDVQLSYNTTTSMGIELPVMSKKEEDDSGLILPRINQADGTFEFTIYTDSADKFINTLKKKNKKTKIPQVDGDIGEDVDLGNDDDDDDGDMFNDSDDINSDLDDEFDSERSDEEDGDQEGQIMLCLYDKVQRIKNKWKSNLKEGIANIDGKDYVFHKATGESEW
ncbi:uncharacterized protein SPAPADRAFT_58617 [Spathaspora passalidarum NRRL Y-27907]|uniref:Transcription initiation factor IIA large subunit n=1 Tax=Spathaspora passalidarum (strain NRRL Y-27907 / 11-Y1) TaxID=619300 RepID=G3AGR6_SPAPN|nr:uncharacterized protein SPAPADRAFT_58617 [Spathaspora passalidarum NRRL Y-27907]EGW35399.1 hypothetical protein SPAPADRAFT_58617 [Spathaspora passalidarum NRRL Y-27907]